MLNTLLLNTGLLNGGPLSTVTAGAHAALKYRLEVHSKAGNTLAYLPQFYAGEWTRRGERQTDEIRFRYDLNAEQATHLTTANQVWLMDEAGTILQKFNIQVVQPLRQEKRLEVQVEGESILGQLTDEWLINYSATATVKNHIKAWLNTYQFGPYPIRLGTIDAAYASTSVKLDIPAKTIRAALDTLYETVGAGHIYVEPKYRRLNWKVRRGRRTGQRIAYRKNLRSITKTEDRREMFTRLYLYGAGNSMAGALNLVDAGQANQYIQQNTGTYGVVSRVIVMKEIETAATLLSVAQALLNEYSIPRVSYEVDALELSYTNDGPDFAFDRLELGSTVTVYDAPLGLNVQTTVTELQYNLDNPLDVKVILDQKRRDLKEYLSDLAERIADLESAPVVFSDATPGNVGTGAAGTSEEASRADHTHGIDTAAIEAIVEATIVYGTDISNLGATESAGMTDQIARADHVHKAYDGNTPSGNGRTAAAGTSEYAARIDHVHPGLKATIVTNYSDLAGLSSPGAGDMAAPTAVNMLYGYINGAWQAVGVWVASGYGTLPTTGVLDGDLAYVTDKDRFYQRSNSAWKILGTFVDTSAPSSVGETNGDAWYDSTNHFYYVRINGTWTRVPYLYSATDKASLANAIDGSLGYTTGSNKYGYFRVNAGWKGITHFE